MYVYRPMAGAESPPEETGGQGGMPMAPAEGQQAGETLAPAPSQEEALKPLLERMDKMGEQIESFAQQGQGQGEPGQGQQQDPTQQPGFQGYDAYGNPLYDQSAFAGQPDQGGLPGFDAQQPQAPAFDPQQAAILQQMGVADEYGNVVNPQAAQAMLQMMSQGQQQGQQMQQLASQLGAMRLELDAGRLEEQYPELQDPEKGEAIVREAQQMAQQMGRPELGANPGFIELVYRAEKAGELSAGETPAGQQQGAELEAAQGAGAPAEGAPDPGEAVVAAGNRGGFWGFPNRG